MNQAWPPPPDLASIKELVANADIEGFLADGAPADEYDTEAELLFSRLETFTTADIVPDKLLPILEGVWTQNFSLPPSGVEQRRPALQELAKQIARFFGPDSEPQVRGL